MRVQPRCQDENMLNKMEVCHDSTAAASATTPCKSVLLGAVVKTSCGFVSSYQSCNAIFGKKHKRGANLMV